MQTEGDTGQYNFADYKLIIVQTLRTSFDFIDAAIIHTYSYSAITVNSG